MTTRTQFASLKSWLGLEASGLLSKKSYTYDSSLRVIEEYLTSVDTKTNGVCLHRSYTYDINNKPIGGTPKLSTWTIAQENNQSSYSDIAIFNLLTSDSSGVPALNVIIGGGTLSLSGLSIAGRMTKVSLTTLWTRVIIAPLANRKLIAFQNQSGNGNIIEQNFNNTDTFGWHIFDSSSIDYTASQSSVFSFYLKMVTGTGVVVINEIS